MAIDGRPFEPRGIAPVILIEIHADRVLLSRDQLDRAGARRRRCLRIPGIDEHLPVDPEPRAVVGRRIERISSAHGSEEETFPSGGPIGPGNARRGRALVTPIEIDRRVDAGNDRIEQKSAVMIGRHQSRALLLNRADLDRAPGSPRLIRVSIVLRDDFDAGGASVARSPGIDQPFQGGVHAGKASGKGHRAIGRAVAMRESQSGDAAQGNTALRGGQRHSKRIAVVVEFRDGDRIVRCAREGDRLASDAVFHRGNDVDRRLVQDVEMIGRNDGSRLARARPFELDRFAADSLGIFQTEVVGLARDHVDGAGVRGAPANMPLIDDQLVVDPESHAVVRGGVEGIGLAVVGGDGSQPARGPIRAFDSLDRRDFVSPN